MKLLLIAGGLWIAAPAFGQRDGDRPGANDSTGASGATTPTVAATTDDGAAGASSGQLINSPQTLPNGGLGVFGDFDIRKINIPNPDPTMPGIRATAEFLVFGGGFGITDKITAGFTYAFELHDDSGTFPNRVKGPLDIYGALNVIHKEKLSVTAGADFNIETGNTDEKVIHAGISVKYVVAPKIAVYSGSPLPLTPAGQQLSISLASRRPITLAVPIGVALQPTSQVFAYVGTELASLSVSNSSNMFMFRDLIPLDASVLFRAVKDLDLGVMILDDLKHAGNDYSVGFTARYYNHN